MFLSSPPKRYALCFLAEANGSFNPFFFLPQRPLTLGLYPEPFYFPLLCFSQTAKSPPGFLRVVGAPFFPPVPPPLMFFPHFEVVCTTDFTCLSRDIPSFIFSPSSLLSVSLVGMVFLRSLDFLSVSHQLLDTVLDAFFTPALSSSSRGSFLRPPFSGFRSSPPRVSAFSPLKFFFDDPSCNAHPTFSPPSYSWKIPNLAF